jgi:flagellar M-ring protein FliF
VTLATTDGALLKRPRSASEGGAETGLADDQLAEVRALEASLEERARTMLERVVGAGHVDVRVAADMDFARVEHTEDHFKPRDPILRSEELMVEKTGAAENNVAGVPGAESNLPTGDAPEEGDAPAGAAGVLRRQHTRNFEVDRVTERRVRQAGVVKRLTVAVVVDGVSTTDESGAVTVQARDEAELEKLEALVRSAVGADDNRQDVVTLQSMSFVSAPVADGGLISPVAATPLEKAKPYLPFVAAGGVFLALVTATMLTRRRRSTVTAVELLPSGELKRENELLSEDAPLLLKARDEALRRASEDPATAALVVRHWLGMGSAAEDGSSRAA